MTSGIRQYFAKSSSHSGSTLTQLSMHGGSDLDENIRCILIGGTSNAGKSSVARQLADQLGWTHISTDSLARHPGRPWKSKPETVPEHVVEHYSKLSTDELIASVLTHYRNIWPLSEALIRQYVDGTETGGLVLEGSALWPELVSSLQLPNIGAVWLTAGDELLRTRIYRESQYDEKDAEGRSLIDKFVGRTLRYNHLMMEDLSRFGLPHIVVDQDAMIDAVADQCLREMRTLV
jgi:2-phosphoglycerate kinase